MNFAVFGDVHGRVALMLMLARAWQYHSRERLDGILQVGDMGAFPNHAKLDDATARHAADDPDELGFVDFLSETDDSRRLLGDPDAPPVLFCRGNHEDFDYLSSFARPTPLDPWEKLWFIPDGTVLEWETEQGPIAIGAFGGAAPLRVPEGRGRRARALRRKRQRRQLAFGMGPRFAAEAADRAFARAERVDILLTHAGPEHPDLKGGSPLLRSLASRLRPTAHLFGHHHQAVGPVEVERSLLVGLDHLEFDGEHLRRGCWGVLRLRPTVEFEWVDAQTHPWLERFDRNYRALEPLGDLARRSSGADSQG